MKFCSERMQRSGINEDGKSGSNPAEPDSAADGISAGLFVCLFVLTAAQVK